MRYKLEVYYSTFLDKLYGLPVFVDFVEKESICAPENLERNAQFGAGWLGNIRHGIILARAIAEREAAAVASAPGAGGAPQPEVTN